MNMLIGKARNIKKKIRKKRGVTIRRSILKVIW